MTLHNGQRRTTLRQRRYMYVARRCRSFPTMQKTLSVWLSDIFGIIKEILDASFRDINIVNVKARLRLVLTFGFSG